jgi:hypothetical protein
MAKQPYRQASRAEIDEENRRMDEIRAHEQDKPLRESHNEDPGPLLV